MKIHLTLATILVAALGCSPSEVGEQKPVTESGAVGSMEALGPPSARDSIEFARAFESAVQRGDDAAITRMIDWEGLLARATDGLATTPRFRETFIKDALHEKGSLGRQLSLTVLRGGSFRLLRTYSKENEQRALYRLLQTGTGLKYLELILGRSGLRDVYATDVYVFLNGERLSQTIRRMAVLSAGQESGRPLGESPEREKDIIEHVAAFQSMSTALRAGNSSTVRDIYHSLPASVQAERTVMLLYVQASRSDDEQYSLAIDDFRRAHPHDAGVDMVSIDGFLIRDQFDEALDAVNGVEAAVGGDPYLNVLRSNINLMRGETGIAEAFAKQAITAEPGLIDAYWALVTASLNKRTFSDTVQLLKTIQDKFNVQFDDLRTNSDYAEFVQSDEFKQWQEAKDRLRGSAGHKRV